MESNAMKQQSDPVIAGLMAKGAPFEVTSTGGYRVFKQAPQNMTAVIDAARQFGNAEFIVSGKRRLTYDDFFEAADNLSAWLINEQGIRPGQSIAICMKNCPEWMIAFVAILNAGGVAVLVNSRGTDGEMARAVSDAECVLVIADEKRCDSLRLADCDLSMLKSDSFPDGRKETTMPTRQSEDLAAMFFTSGTTGVAKAAAIQHRALITGVMNTQMAMAAVFLKMAQAYGIDVETLRAQMPQSCSLLVFPLFHTSGCSAVFLTSLVSGGKLVLMDHWNGDDALALIEREKITTFGGVPAMHWDVLNSANLGKHDLSSLMSISCGGQALPLNLLAEIREHFPKAYIGAGYGMTETCGAISQANGEAFLLNPKASGQILPMFDVQVTGENGKPRESGEIGEIWVKGAALMQGYYGRPDETAASMSGDWFKTGDIGRVDKNGYIYIVDRKTDMVISGGENIYCAEVEQVLGQHPDVLQVATFAVPDDRLGERLIASIYTLSEILDEDINAFAKAHLAGYKMPTEITMHTEPFAMNAMGKVNKQRIRAAYLAKFAA
jgi:acyl-CoA synthetase (AMP-forming)/AMP-acid ligase II